MTTGGAAPLRLKNRKDFVAAARGARRHARSFVLQARPRDDDEPPRFGLTVSKKTEPSAVRRNRIRRRLKEALRLGAALSGAPGHDYVLIARREALAAPFADLKQEIAAALASPLRERSRKPRPSHP
ncbi:MAG: ribonuclease P protein component [Hyphomicrobiales bacterium]|nr:ribonuclease P protein component [Hyphomicrobiales bacterium]